MKKVMVLLTMAVLILVFSKAFALPPTSALPPLHAVDSMRWLQMVENLDGSRMVNPITIYSDKKMDIFIFENFMNVKNRTIEQAMAMFSKTGNFGTVLYYEIKDEALRKQLIADIRNKIKRRDEFEKREREYIVVISEGKPAVGPAPRADMMDYFVSTFQRQDKDGVPKDAELLKWIKSIVYFDMQHNKMIELKKSYIDQNGELIGWISFQDEIDLSTAPIFNGIAHDITAMLQKTIPPKPPSPQQMLQEQKQKKSTDGYVH